LIILHSKKARYSVDYHFEIVSERNRCKVIFDKEPSSQEEEAMQSVDDEKSLVLIEKSSNKKEQAVIATQNTQKASDNAVILPKMSDSLNQYYFAIGMGMVLYVLSHFVKKSREKKYKIK